MVADWYLSPSNFSNGTEVNGTGSFIQYVSYLTGDWLATGFLFLIWIFAFGMSLMAGSRKALLTSSFITFCFSIYFIRLNIINPIIVAALLGLTIVGAICSFDEKGL